MRPNFVAPLVAFVAAGVLAASVLNGVAIAGQQRLFLNPNPVITGGTVTASGSGFCHAADCSKVTIAVGNGVLASGIDVRPDGTFVEQVSALLGPGLYTVIASQQAGGQTIAASTDLIVTVGDFVTPMPPAGPTVIPSAQTPTATPPPPGVTPDDLLTPGATPTEPTGQRFDPSLQVQPTVVAPGEPVTIVGQAFCAEAGCAQVTIVLDDIVVSTGISVDRAGSFEERLEAPNAPGRFVIAASQSDEQGNEVSAQATLTVKSDGPPSAVGGGSDPPWYAWLIAVLALGGMVVWAGVNLWRRSARGQ